MKSQMQEALPLYDGNTVVSDPIADLGANHPNPSPNITVCDDDADSLVDLFGKQTSVPLDRKQLPAILNDYLDIATRGTDAKPGLLITAWLPYVAVNLGNRAYMLHNSTPIYPNIWSCVIGPSSISRKSTALRFADYTIAPYEDQLAQAETAEYEKKTMRLNSITLSKLITFLAQNSTRLYVLNEVTGWMDEMNKSFNAGYKQTITELFDGMSRTFANRERTERIINPALSIAAASTEGWFYRSMRDGADQMSGFLQRMLFYVVRNVNLDDLTISIRDSADLREEFKFFNTHIFNVWRSIPGSFELRLSKESREYRDVEYERMYRKTFQRNNDALMSYFTRLYDCYWFKFCTIFTLAWRFEELRDAIAKGQCAKFFQDYQVDLEEAVQAMELCHFYMRNTTPFLAIMDEQDKLGGERKVIDLLISKFGGKAGHTALMNKAHMKKREFMEHIENLIERGAVNVETYLSSKKKPGRRYVLNKRILDSWLSN